MQNRAPGAAGYAHVAHAETELAANWPPNRSRSA